MGMEDVALLPWLDTFALHAFYTYFLPWLDTFALHAFNTYFLPWLDTFALHAFYTYFLPWLDTFALHAFNTYFFMWWWLYMASGLPQVFEDKQGPAPCKTFCCKILMVVEYCGCQLAQQFGWLTCVYFRKKGATPHPGAYRHSLQYDVRPDWRLRVLVDT